MVGSRTISAPRSTLAFQRTLNLKLPDKVELAGLQLIRHGTRDGAAKGEHEKTGSFQRV